MPTYTGTQLARAALRELGVIDPTEAGDPELISDAIDVGSDMLDSWRLDNLTIPSITRSLYPLSANTQDYTIGDGGTFNQDYPNAIEMWSVVPDSTVADPLELPMGRPLTYDQWSGVRIKSQTGPYPVRMYFDHAFVAGFGLCEFHPIPAGPNVQAVLYSSIPALTTIVANTQYNLRPGMALAIKTNWAIELADRLGRTLPGRLEKRAAKSLGLVKRGNIRPLEARIQSQFVIGGGSGRRNFNIYTGGR